MRPTMSTCSATPRVELIESDEFFEADDLLALYTLNRR